MPFWCHFASPNGAKLPPETDQKGLEKVTFSESRPWPVLKRSWGGLGAVLGWSWGGSGAVLGGPGSGPGWSGEHLGGLFSSQKQPRVAKRG